MAKTIYVMQNENGEQYWIHRIEEMRVYDDINEYSSDLEFDEIKSFNVISKYEYDALMALYTLNNMNETNDSGLYLKMYGDLQENVYKNSTPLINTLMENI